MIKYFHIYIYFLVSKRIIVTINRYIIVDKYEYITNRYDKIHFSYICTVKQSCGNGKIKVKTILLGE